jgi:hypothetical protein
VSRSEIGGRGGGNGGEGLLLSSEIFGRGFGERVRRLIFDEGSPR